MNQEKAFNKGILEISNNEEDGNSRVTFKKGKIEPPQMYLGATVQEKQLNGYDCWTMSSTSYIKAALETIQE